MALFKCKVCGKEENIPTTAVGSYMTVCGDCKSLKLREFRVWKKANTEPVDSEWLWNTAFTDDKDRIERIEKEVNDKILPLLDNKNLMKDNDDYLCLKYSCKNKRLNNEKFCVECIEWAFKLYYWIDKE